LVASSRNRRNQSSLNGFSSTEPGAEVVVREGQTKGRQAKDTIESGQAGSDRSDQPKSVTTLNAGLWQAGVVSLPVAPSFPELDVEKVRRWCRDRVRAKFADQVRLEVSRRGKSNSIHECRACLEGVGPEAGPRQLSLRSGYEGDGTCTLCFVDHYAKWTMYFDLDTNQLITALDEIGLDPTGVFWD
jgi:hypothetical protein